MLRNPPIALRYVVNYASALVTRHCSLQRLVGLQHIKSSNAMLHNPQLHLVTWTPWVLQLRSASIHPLGLQHFKGLAFNTVMGIQFFYLMLYLELPPPHN